jgi:Thioesterase-like superfamily
MLHGRLIAALAARAAEERAEGFTPTRLTIDLFRAAPMEPVHVHAETVRDGGRVRVVHVVVTCAGREAARASALLLRPGPEPEGRVWGPESWSVPDPGDLSPSVEEDDELASLDIRMISPGGLTVATQKRLWVREIRPLVEGEETSSFVRAVAAADLANPFGNIGEAGLAFINADLTVYVGRLPVGQWIGLEIAARSGSGAVANVGANLYDCEGGFGSGSVASVATGTIGVPTQVAT